MKKLIVAIMLFFTLVIHPLFSQEQSSIWPWIGMEEFIYHNLPIGGWNLFGAFSPRSTAMGETTLSSLHPSAGYLNPALLTSVSNPMFALSYRYTDINYETYSGVAGWPWIDFTGQKYSFGRATNYIDNIGFVIPFDKWAFSGSYFLFQEFNFPEIKTTYYWSSEKVKQSGQIRGLNFALSNCLTSYFSLGVSVSYIFGEISRFDVTQDIYRILETGDFDPNLNLRQVTYMSIPAYVYLEDFDLDLKGFLFTLGFTFELSEKWLIGFMLRPPSNIKLRADMERTYPDIKISPELSSNEYSLKQPFVVMTSVLYKPISCFQLAADISYWNWSNASTDYRPNWYYPYHFKGIFKLNLGAEYQIKLPFDLIERVNLRAGYIYDPQPYQYYESFARDFFCTGFSIQISDFDFHAAAKICLSPSEIQRFHSNLFRVGMSYKF